MEKHRLFSVFDQYRHTPASVRGFSTGVIESLPLFYNQFAYIVDYSNGTVKRHKGIDRCLGYNQPEFSIEQIMSWYHPDESDQIMEMVARNMEWTTLFPSEPFGTTFTIDHRVRKANAEYIRVLRQTSVIEVNETGKMICALSTCTDISHLKMEGRISARLTGPSMEILVSYEDIVNSNRGDGVVRLSAREMDILVLIAKGKTSAQIADALNISVNTVNTHRRNMLVRTGFSNIAQVIGHVARKGMI